LCVERGKQEAQQQQDGEMWRRRLAVCVDDADWEVGLRTLELLRCLAGIPGPALVDAQGRCFLCLFHSVS
jgi:hypothetical protein